MNINELLAAIDNTRRQYGQNVLAAVQNPVEAFQNSLARYAQENLPTPAERQDAMSVMPGMGDAMMQKVNALAMNSFNPAMTVWHGSPHLFDKFDISKIGTGEGAQAFGHGLYVAENPKVAGQYQALGERVFHDGPLDWNNPVHVGIRASDLAGGRQAGIDRLMDTVKARTAAPENKAIAQQAIDFLKSGESFDKYATSKGALYKVDLPDEHIAKMLDWDKPLSQQPKSVKDALRKSNFAPDEAVWKHYTGQQFYEGEMQANGPYKATGWANPESRVAVSEKLKQAGIPGIKYLDQGSRDFRIIAPKESTSGKWVVGPRMGDKAKQRYFDDETEARDYFAKNSTRNFVVFDDKLLKILGRE